MHAELLSPAAVVVFLLKATGVLLLTLVTAAMLRRASAGTKHTLWLTALVLVLALPLLATTLPQWRVLPVASTTLGFTADTGPEGGVERSSAVAPPDLAEVVSGTPTSTGAPAPALAPAERARAAVSSWISSFDVAAWLIALWMAGALLTLGRLAASALTLRRTLADADPLDGSEWTTPLWEACDRLDLKAAPRLLSTERVAMPFACGLLQPTIVLPATAEEWSLQRRRAVLFHELAHIRRRDLLGHTLGRIACALYWMHPLVWTAARRLRAESERACDDLVLASGTPASEYADHLLQILVGVRGNDAPAVALPMGRRREFEGRMLAILDPALRRSGSLLVHGGVLVALSLGALTLMAMAPAQVASEPPLASRSSDESLQADEEATLVSITTDGLRLELRAGGAAEGQGEIIAGRDVLEAPEPHAPPTHPEPPHPASADPHPQSDPRPLASLLTAAERVVEGTVNNFVSGTMSLVFGFGSEDEKNIPLLIRLLETDESGEVRRTAAWALAGEPGEEVAAALLRALRDDDDAEVREMAAWGLREVTTAAAIGALVRSVVDDSSPDVRARAAWALGRPGLRSNGVLEALATALADGNAEVRELAAWALGTIHPAQAPVALYQRGLRDPEPEVRTAAAWAIGQIRDPAAKPALAAAFASEGDNEPLEALTWALLKLGPLDSSAVEALLGSSDPEIRARAIRIAAGVELDFWPWPWPWPEPRPMP